MFVTRLAAGMLLAATLAFAGCAVKPTSVLEGGTSLTATVANPVQPRPLFETKLVYASAQKLVIRYRAYCYRKPFAELQADAVDRPVCGNRRVIIGQLQSAEDKAYRAIKAAEQFASNSSLSAVTALQAAWSAVSTFQSLASRSAVPAQ
jgi:hypothetical protein